MEKSELFKEIKIEYGWKDVVKKYEEECPCDEEGEFLWVFRVRYSRLVRPRYPFFKVVSCSSSPSFFLLLFLSC